MRTSTAPLAHLELARTRQPHAPIDTNQHLTDSLAAASQPTTSIKPSATSSNCSAWEKRACSSS